MQSHREEAGCLVRKRGSKVREEAGFKGRLTPLAEVQVNVDRCFSPVSHNWKWQGQGGLYLPPADSATGPTSLMVPDQVRFMKHTEPLG